MQIKPFVYEEIVTVRNRRGSTIFRSTTWPRGLQLTNYLRALCGAPDKNGWYVYHEDDCTWISSSLRLASELTRENVGTLAIADPLNLRQTPAYLSELAFGTSEPNVSLLAASALATKVFAKAWAATEEEASEIVRMNMFAERAVV